MPYNCEKVYYRMDQLKNPNCPLFDVWERHFYELSKLMPKQGFDYRLGMMTVIVSADEKSAGVTVDLIIREEIGQKLVEDGYYLVLLDYSHGHAAVHILCKTGNSFGMLTISSFILSCVMMEP